MLGLEGIEAGRDWRGPIADRMLISSADGGGAINDAVRVSARLVDSGRRLAGLPPEVAPKEGAQFHFSHPGSVQGFMAAGDGATHIVVGNVPLARRPGLAGPLRRSPRRAGRGADANFRAPRSHAHAHIRTHGDAPRLFGGNGPRTGDRRPQQCGSGPRRSARARLRRGRLPLAASTGSRLCFLLARRRSDVAFARHRRTAHPVARARPSFERRAADGAVMLDYLRWDGPPDVRLRRPDGPGEFWRRAWVNAVEVFSTSFPQAFRISQDSGEGMIIHGGRQWTDYRVETTLTVHCAEHAGDRRAGAGPTALLRGASRAARSRSHRSRFRWRRDHPRRKLLSNGPSRRLTTLSSKSWAREIEARVGGVALKARDESPFALEDGGIALIVQWRSLLLRRGRRCTAAQHPRRGKRGRRASRPRLWRL